MFPGISAAPPLYLAKILGLDFQPVVVFGPLIYHCSIILIADRFFSKLVKLHVGEGIGYEITMLLYLSNFSFAS